MTTVSNLHKWYRALNFILFLASFHLLLCFLTWATLLIHCLQILLVNLSGCICILEKYVMSLLGVHLIGTNGTVPWILYSLRFLLKHSPPGVGGFSHPHCIRLPACACSEEGICPCHVGPLLPDDLYSRRTFIITLVCARLCAHCFPVSSSEQLWGKLSNDWNTESLGNQSWSHSY